MKDKAHKPSDIQIKPASGPTETRGLQNLPSLLQGLAEAQQGGQAQQPTSAQQGGAAGASESSGDQGNATEK
jgi:hypothetical protein